MKRNKARNTTVYLVKIAMLAAISTVLYTFLRFPIFPPPYHMLDFDLTFVPSLYGGFALGPMAAVAIEAIRIGIKLIMQPTTTFYVGELSSFIVSIAFVLPASLIYKFNKTRKGALIGMVVGVLINVLVSCLSNYFVILPMYIRLYGAKAAIYQEVRTLFAFGYGLAFNLIKTVAASIIVFFTYKRLSKILHL